MEDGWVVIVTKGSVPYVYGIWSMKEDANDWAQTHLGGQTYDVGQYINPKTM